jgi:hypothetical protein
MQRSFRMIGYAFDFYILVNEQRCTLDISLKALLQLAKVLNEILGRQECCESIVQPDEWGGYNGDARLLKLCNRESACSRNDSEFQGKATVSGDKNNLTSVQHQLKSESTSCPRKEHEAPSASRGSQLLVTPRSIWFGVTLRCYHHITL